MSENDTPNTPLYIDAELFAYYEIFFHDGTLLNIKKIKNDLLIEIESQEIWICDNRDNIPLSERNTLYGILHLRGIRSIKKNKEEVSSLKIKYEYGNLMDFKLAKSSVFMCGNWEGLGADRLKDDWWFEIEVEATEIYWENTADIQDLSLLGKYRGIPGVPPFAEYPQWYIDKYGHQSDEGIR